jgi:hypothetical protein
VDSQSAFGGAWRMINFIGVEPIVEGHPRRDYSVLMRKWEGHPSPVLPQIERLTLRKVKSPERRWIVLAWLSRSVINLPALA